MFRVPGDDPETVRDADDLPLEEVANAALSIVRDHVSVPEEDLVRETGRLLGFRRSGPRVEARMRAGVAHLLEHGAATRKGADIVGTFA
jgi:hypothetical protein